MKFISTVILILTMCLVGFSAQQVKSKTNIIVGTGSTRVLSYDTLEYKNATIEGFFSFESTPLLWGGDDTFGAGDSIIVDWAPIMYPTDINISFPGTTRSNFTKGVYVDTLAGWTNIFTKGGTSIIDKATLGLYTITPKVCNGLVFRTCITNSAAGDCTKVKNTLYYH